MGKDVQPLQIIKTSILAELTVRSGLGDIYIKGDESCVLNMLIIYYLMLYIIYVTLIMRLWELYNLVAIYTCGVRHGLTLAISPKPQEKFRLVINQSVGFYRKKLIPEVGVVYPLYAIKGYLFLYYVRYIFMHCLLILPLICSYM